MKPQKFISAASIVIRRPAIDPHEGLRRLIEGSGTNKHDRAIVFISAAIGQGVTAGPAIIALGAKLGLNPKHVAIVLHQEAGANVERHRWRRDADGDYSMLP